ncbi:MAG: cysteine desulfuration protein SufE [Oceanicaulis sp. HLUCCA04]|nr:MAG: cysteine desulfuration protein SufE [Oceanicaulis sp. HLUCCA04]
MDTKDPVIEALVDEFDFLGDWEERYRYLIDMGRALEPLSADEHCDTNKVQGCVSQVWLVLNTAPDGTLAIRGDSDAHIVKGLVALLIRLYSGRPPAEAAAIDAREVLGRIGLGEHLSPQRSNGLAAMVTRIRAVAGNS